MYAAHVVQSPPSPRDDLIGEADASPAGPTEEGAQLRPPPEIPLSRSMQTLRFSRRQIQFVFRARRELGGVFGVRFVVIPGGVVITVIPITCGPCSPPSRISCRR